MRCKCWDVLNERRYELPVIEYLYKDWLGRCYLYRLCTACKRLYPDHDIHDHRQIACNSYSSSNSRCIVLWSLATGEITVSASGGHLNTTRVCYLYCYTTCILQLTKAAGSIWQALRQAIITSKCKRRYR